MKFFIIEANDRTGQAEMLDAREDKDEAIAIAKAHLAFLPASTIEAGFTVIVEDNQKHRVWGVQRG